MIHCAIVDDEPLARQNLEVLLSEHADFDVCLSSGSSEEALEAVLRRPPDLVFLDVKMPRLDGLGFLTQMRERLTPSERPYAILVTAFDRFALQAFEYEALDYLVKPFDSERFEISLRRARDRIELGRHAEAFAKSSTKRQTRLTFKISSGELYLLPEEICWVESADHYLFLHTPRRSHLVRGTMVSIERTLGPFGFLRVHRSALVNPGFVVSHQSLPDGGRLLTLREGSRIRISRRRWPEIRPEISRQGPPA